MTHTITLDTPMNFLEAMQYLADGKCVGIKPKGNSHYLVPYRPHFWNAKDKRIALAWYRSYKDGTVSNTISDESYLGEWFPVVLDTRRLPIEIKHSLLLENITGVLDNLTYEKN
jgi:hypothetical protein